MFSRIADAVEGALSARFAPPIAAAALLIWQAAVLFVFLADYPLLFGDSPIYLVNGLKPFELDWRELAGMHVHPIANPGVLMWPFLKAAGCEWGGGDVAACSLGFKAYVVPASLAPLFALYWLMRRWVSQAWALAAILTTAVLSNGFHSITFTSISTVLALAAAIIMFRAVLDLAETGRRRDRILVVAMPVAAALTSISGMTVFGATAALACAFSFRSWKTLAPPLALGFGVAFLSNAHLYQIIWTNNSGALVSEGLEILQSDEGSVRGGIWLRIAGAAYNQFSAMAAGLIAAAAMLFSARYRPLGALSFSLYIYQDIVFANSALANLNIRSAQMGELLYLCVAFIGVEWLCRSYLRGERRGVAVLVVTLLLAVAVYKPFLYFDNREIDTWRDANNHEIVLIAKDFADGLDSKAVWVFPAWHESTLYGVLYETDGALHSAYAVTGTRPLAIEARTAIGMIGGEVEWRAAVRELGATHAFALLPSGEYSSWARYLRLAAKSIEEIYGEPLQCGRTSREHEYCIYSLKDGE